MRKEFPRPSRVLAYIALFVVVIASFLPSKNVSALHLWGTDKLHHCMAYALITMLFFWSRRQCTIARSWLFAWLLWMMSGMIEIFQPILSLGRECDIYDFVANGFGILGAALLFLGWRAASKSRTNS